MEDARQPDGLGGEVRAVYGRAESSCSPH
jgi:hypothetical protein